MSNQMEDYTQTHLLDSEKFAKILQLQFCPHFLLLAETILYR